MKRSTFIFVFKALPFLSDDDVEGFKGDSIDHRATRIPRPRARSRLLGELLLCLKQRVVVGERRELLC